MKIINLSVKIEYDPITDSIINYSTSLEGVEEKKTTTTKRSTSKKNSGLEGSKLVKEENKLVLSEQLVADLEASHEDRIAVCYETIDDKYFPVIGLESRFGGKGSGNKLTKSNTVAFKGKQNETLAEFGTEFTAEPYTEGVFKLVGNAQSTLHVPQKQAIKAVDMGIEITGDTNYAIDEITNFTL